MNTRPTELERAFTLARSGEYDSVSAVRAKLKSEGYSTSQLEGATLIRQLRQLCQAAKPVAESEAETPEAKD